MKEQPLTIDTAAERLNISRRTVYALVWTGRLKAFRAGRVLRIEPSEIEAFKARNAVQVADPVEPPRVAVPPKRSKFADLPGANRYVS